MARFPIGLVLLLAAPAVADEASLVVVLAPAERTPGLDVEDVTDALDLSLADLGIRARPGPPAPAGDEDAQLAGAREAGQGAHALAVVWYAPAEGGRVRVHVLDTRAARTTVQVFVVDAGSEGAPRVLALKVRHLLRYALLEQAPRSPEVGALVAPVVRRAAPPLRSRAHISIGWALGFGPSGIRHGPAASFGFRAVPWAEGRLAFAFLDSGERTVSTGRVRTEEANLGLEAHALLHRGAFETSLGPALRLHFLASRGTASDGRSGTGGSVVPEVALVLGARAPIVRTIALETDVSLGWIFGRQRVLLRGEEAFDLGRIGLELRLGLTTPGL